MDFLERLNRRFGNWYEKLFGAQGDELRPRDILRQIVAAMEDARREGLDSQIYVPNVYTLKVAVDSEEERQYLRAFLDADELASAVAEKIGQHGYKTRGPLVFIIEEVEGESASERIQIVCKWEAQASLPTPAPAPAPSASEPDLRTVAAPFAKSSTPSLGALIVVGSDGRQQEYPLGAAGLKLGRGKQVGNDIVLESDGMISRKHARLVFEAGRVVLYDEGSANGTFVGSERVVPGRGVPLDDGDSFVLGQTRVTLQLEGGDPGTVPSPFGGAAATPTPSTAYALVTEDGTRYPLASRMLLGRALTDDIVLVGEGISAQHARITQRDGIALIEDLGSTSGTVVNGERIPTSFPVALYPGDTITLGAATLRLTAGARL